MDSGSVGILVALVVLLVLSAFFSASEMAYSSLNRIRLKNLAANGDKKAKRALDLSDLYDKLLSTVLIGNNVVNIASSSLATVLFVAYFGTAGVSIATVVMTVLVLMFGEISPKTIAKESPEQFAMFAAPILRVFVILFTPINFLFSAWKRFILRVFRVDTNRQITEEELLTYVDEVRQDGGINKEEESMIRSAIEFDDLEAIDIYTPRVDVTACSITDSNEQIAAAFYETGFSRLPVYEESIDNVIGILLNKDFHYYVQKLKQPVRSVLRPPVFVTKTVKISKLLTELRHQKAHAAIIMDEFGGMLGLVTIEDIVEVLVGDIWDEHDEIVEKIEKLDENAYLIQGGTQLSEIISLFGIQTDSESVTLGGWLIEQMGRIPEEGAEFDFENLHFIVQKMEKHRVVSVLVERNPETDEL